MISYVVTKQHEKIDLYDLLESVYPNFSLKDQDKALKYGDIDFNGERADGTEHLKQGDRVDIFLPADIVGIDLMENNLLGDNQTHRLVLRCQKPIWRMGKVIKKL